MAFNSDKQRKAFFAQKGTLRSKVIPSISGRIKGIKEKLRQRQEKLGRERIEKEKILLKKETEQAQRLKAEAEVEIQREQVAQQRRLAQQKLMEIERARFERKVAPLKAGFKRARAGFKKLSR